MEIVFDAAVVLIIAVAAIVGYCRGFVKYIVLLLVTVASVFAGAAGAQYLTDPIYDKFVDKEISSAAEKVAESIDLKAIVQNYLTDAGYEKISSKITDEDVKTLFNGGDIADNAEALVIKKGGKKADAAKVKEKISSTVNNNISEKINKTADNKYFGKVTENLVVSNGQIINTARLLAQNEKKEAAVYMNDKVFKPVVKTVLKVIVFFAVFILASLIIRLILRMLGILKNLPGSSAVNKIGGLVLGLAKGVLYVGLIAFAVCYAINSTNDSISGFNAEMVENTRLFKYFFDFFYK